jgi:small-conductance mechanosensitive channel
MELKEILELGLTIGKHKITVADILAVFLIILAARLLTFLVNHVALKRYFKKKNLDIGRQYAVRQFAMYIIYLLAVFAVLEMIGVFSLILASSAALLVGIGLGLQDAFKDLVSGIIILVEGSVEVEDVIQIGDMPARVKKIGLRTSVVETKDHNSILIPNSKLVMDAVMNMSHNKTATRFSIKVGVAYGSDVALVRQLLLQAAGETSKVLNNPVPTVQFKDFGDSSLDFSLLFFSKEFLAIEQVKSDLRFAVERLFRENNVTIPFPQRDLWLKNPEAFGR